MFWLPSPLISVLSESSARATHIQSSQLLSFLLDVLLHTRGNDTAAVMADSPACLACSVHHREYSGMTATGASGSDECLDECVHHAVPIGLASGSPNQFLGGP